MREILFKAKDIQSGIWRYGDYTYNRVTNKHFILIVDDKGWCTDHEIDPETLCQYTGLEDVDGNKIFEGDFREGSYYCGDDRIFYKDYVVFEDCSFRWKNCEGYSCYGMPDFCYNKIEGNIHD